MKSRAKENYRVAPFAKKLLPSLILLFAFLIRADGLLNTPPGLTHDEAGHAHDAAQILKGITPIYFTVGYGREPLFDYLNAGWIALLGANLFTLRFAAVCWGTLTLALTYHLARIAFNKRVALIALALMAVSFWQLNTSRQILRSDLLPVEVSVAVILFLKLTSATPDRSAYNSARFKFSKTCQVLLTVGLALALAASFYTYIPSRILWLIFPLSLIAQAISHQPSAISKQATRHTLYAIAISFLLASPLFLYLYQNPEAEQRLGMLNAPLTQLQNGDPSALLNNMRELFFAFFINGHGDHFLAYTIPGRALFDPITAGLFVVGALLLLKLSVISNQSSVTSNQLSSNSQLSTIHYPLFTFWFLLGILPSLITGPEALTTRLIAIQPLLYIIPAITLNQLLVISNSSVLRLPSFVLVSLFIASLFITSVRDYLIWGNSPEVRAAYRSTTIAIAQQIDSPSVISTIYPSATHDPYVAEIFTSRETRWIDGRTAMLIPNQSTYKLLLPSSTPLHPAFKNYVQPLRTVQLRSNDLDSLFTFHSIINYQLPTPLANFNNALTLLDARWSVPAYKPSDTAELITVWRVVNANNLGALHPPAYKTELNLFTHILKEGEVYLQRDALDAPSWSWQTGDTIIQVHQIALPADIALGEYQTRVGVYDRVTNQRLGIRDAGDDSVLVTPLLIK